MNQFEKYCTMRASRLDLKSAHLRIYFISLELQIIHDGGCRVEFVHQLYGAAVCDIAKVKYEWNPVCASDGVTYPNPFLFLCHHPRT